MLVEGVVEGGDGRGEEREVKVGIREEGGGCR